MSDPWKSFDSSQLPLFAAVAGVELPVEEYAIAPGLKLARAYIDVFGIPMMSFAAPVNPGAAHPGPWVAVRGSSNFESRAELQLSTELAGDIPPHTIIWLIADLLRIHLHTPIRVPVLGNMSFRSMADHHKEALGHSFEASPNQVGLFYGRRATISEHGLIALRDTYPKLLRLSTNELFARTFTIFDEASWMRSVEQSTSLIWTALETVFGLSAARSKAKVLAGNIAHFLRDEQPDRDRLYSQIKSLYEARGSFTHAARDIPPEKFKETVQLARDVFAKIINEESLPIVHLDEGDVPTKH